MSLLQKIKQGKKNYKTVNFPGSDVKVAIVIQSSETITQCTLKAKEYSDKQNITDENTKEIILQQYLVYEFLRDNDDLNKKVIDSMDEARTLEINELAYLTAEYTLLSVDTSPFLSAVTEDQLDLLKKTLEKMTLRDLSGESLIALRSFLMTL